MKSIQASNAFGDASNRIHDEFPLRPGTVRARERNPGDVHVVREAVECRRVAHTAVIAKKYIDDFNNTPRGAV